MPLVFPIVGKLADSWGTVENLLPDHLDCGSRAVGQALWGPRGPAPPTRPTQCTTRGRLS